MTDTKPVAWHFKCDEYESVTLLKQHADAMAEFYKTKAVPLYYAATITDAVPEAKAAEPESSVPLGSGAAPAKQGPVAWMVENDDGERWMCHNHPAAAKYGLKCFPLFAKPQPTLTDAEREAIELAAAELDGEYHGPNCTNERTASATLRKLLERLK
jgi:hypothetical protein